MLVAAVPVPSSEQEQSRGLEIVQIPLQGNKVCAMMIYYIYELIKGFQ